MSIKLALNILVILVIVAIVLLVVGALLGLNTGGEGTISST